MFEFLAPVFVLGIIMLGVYRLCELYARRKERIMIIEKMQENTKPEDLLNQLSLPLVGKQHSSSWTLRAGLLMIGISLGFIVGLLIHLSLIPSLTGADYHMSPRELVAIIYTSSVILFGGIGLLLAHLIEHKKEKKQIK